MKLAFYTSITNSYFAKARILAQSVKRHYPNSHFILALLDRTDLPLTEIEPSIDEVWNMESSDFDAFDHWIYEHDVVEACTAQKGFAIQAFLRREEYDAVIYLDPDIRLFGPMPELEEMLQSSAVVVTPHLTAPSKSKRSVLDNEFSALQHGAFNLGFVAVAAGPSGLEVADWWDSRLRTYCFDEKNRGLFTDQKWFDLVPGMFDSVGILRHPGYNVATWNLEHRKVSRTDDGLRVNGLPLRFIHFSGYDSRAHHMMLDAYAADQPEFKKLSYEYEELLNELFVPGVDDQEWCFKKNRRGQVIPRQWRRDYRDNPNLRYRFPDPFEISSELIDRTVSADPLSVAIETCQLSPDNLDAYLAKYRATRMASSKVAVGDITEDHTQRIAQLNASLGNGRTTIGLVEHGLGGGLEIHTQQLCEMVSPTANIVKLRVRRISDGSWTLRVSICSSIGELRSEEVSGNAQALHGFLESLSIDRMHVHSIYRSEEFWLPYLLKLDRPLDVTIHDFTLLTSNWSMDDAKGGTFPVDSQADIIKQSFSRSRYRQEIEDVVQRADRVIFPSRAARAIFEESIKLSRALVSLHPEFPPPELVPLFNMYSRAEKSRGLKVAILGDLASHKGLHVIHELAETIKTSGTTIELFHFGDPHPLLAGSVRSLGRYSRRDISPRLNRLGIHAVVVPSQVHETYGYVLSDALFAGLPIVATRVGAFPERLAGKNGAVLLDADAKSVSWIDAIRSVTESDSSPSVQGSMDLGLIESRYFYRTAYLT